MQANVISSVPIWSVGQGAFIDLERIYLVMVKRISKATWIVELAVAVEWLLSVYPSHLCSRKSFGSGSYLHVAHAGISLLDIYNVDDTQNDVIMLW